ncbi:MAG: nuclear transport factor 2 family protein [Gammaproteobacteria bacterium]
MSNLIEFANRWIAAYNAKDFDTLRGMMAPDMHIEHHNRGVVLDGAEAMLTVMRQFGDLLPDRRFHSVRRQFAAGDTVVSELTWEATPTVDIDGFAKKGETIRLELACLWTVREGRLVDYHDYG